MYFSKAEMCLSTALVRSALTWKTGSCLRTFSEPLWKRIYKLCPALDPKLHSGSCAQMAAAGVQQGDIVSKRSQGNGLLRGHTSSSRLIPPSCSAQTRAQPVDHFYFCRKRREGVRSCSHATWCFVSDVAWKPLLFSALIKWHAERPWRCCCTCEAYKHLRSNSFESFFCYLENTLNWLTFSQTNTKPFFHSKYHLLSAEHSICLHDLSVLWWSKCYYFILLIKKLAKLSQWS